MKKKYFEYNTSNIFSNPRFFMDQPLKVFLCVLIFTIIFYGLIFNGYKNEMENNREDIKSETELPLH